MTRWFLLFLVVLVSCERACPQGYVSANVRGSPACISSVSYCVKDEQCTSVRYHCESPCEEIPVNTLFSVVALNKAQTCPHPRCPQVPVVDHTCVDFVCQARPHKVDELIPVPVFLEVEPGKEACVVKTADSSHLRLRVWNNASMPLMQLEAFMNVSFVNGSNLRVRADLLKEPLAPNGTRDINQPIEKGTPKTLDVFAVRKVKTTQIVMGVRNEDSYVEFRLKPCGANVTRGS